MSEDFTHAKLRDDSDNQDYKPRKIILDVVSNMEAYGPVPSRRLGQSIGINHIPPKVCTYSCIYRQLGKTMRMQLDRNTFYSPEEVLRKVEEQVSKAWDKII